MLHSGWLEHVKKLTWHEIQSISTNKVPKLLRYYSTHIGLSKVPLWPQRVESSGLVKPVPSQLKLLQPLYKHPGT